MALFAYREEIPFSELVANTDRSTLVVTFLALLEMMRNHNLTIRQHEQFDEIILCKPSADGSSSTEQETTASADTIPEQPNDNSISSLKELKQRERREKTGQKHLRDATSLDTTSLDAATKAVSQMQAIGTN
jgi:hypothetical protein